MNEFFTTRARQAHILCMFYLFMYLFISARTINLFISAPNTYIVDISSSTHTYTHIHTSHVKHKRFLFLDIPLSCARLLTLARTCSYALARSLLLHVIFYRALMFFRALSIAINCSDLLCLTFLALFHSSSFVLRFLCMCTQLFF